MDDSSRNWVVDEERTYVFDEIGHQRPAGLVIVKFLIQEMVMARVGHWWGMEDEEDRFYEGNDFKIHNNATLQVDGNGLNWGRIGIGWKTRGSDTRAGWKDWGDDSSNRTRCQPTRIRTTGID